MGRAGGNAHCEHNAMTATPWMSLMRATRMMSRLFTRNTAVQDNIRTLLDYLNATIPGAHR
eukprot:9491033-Pyramimonas_sp.AAC.1